ncbi:MAG: hypothetical protein AAB692_02135 [Patescibacteria group bacterium]
MQRGLKFEECLADELRKIGVVVTTSPRWDLEEKTDQLVPKINGRRLKASFEVQVTTNIGNHRKIAAYLEAVKDRKAIKVYIEFFSNLTPDVAARREKEILIAILAKNPKPGDTFGVIVPKHGRWRFYDPEQKRDYLEVKAAKAADEKLRRKGRITLIWENHVIINDEGRCYWAGRNFIKDQRIRTMMQEGPHGCPPVTLTASFIPMTQGRPNLWARGVVLENYNQTP